MKSVLFICLVLVPSGSWAVSPKLIASIDQMSLDIDRRSSNIMTKKMERLSDHTSVETLSYWSPGDKRIQKVIVNASSDNSPESITSRYYQKCRLILVRVAPHVELVQPEQIEKYYFQKGKLVHVTFGGETKQFPKEQWSYYERTYGGAPQECYLK